MAEIVGRRDDIDYARGHTKANYYRQENENEVVLFLRIAPGLRISTIRSSHASARN